MKFAPLLLLLAACSGAPEHLHEPPNQIRAIWVTRWDYKEREDISTIFKNCKSLGVTDVFFQVRGRADAFYKSEIEPWGEELGGDPGFDPLEAAVTSAHVNELRLHAWINVATGWGGTTEPKDKAHIRHAHPEYFALLKDGEKQKLVEHYNVLNLCDRRVHDYLARVVEEIASRYAVDGIHLDYARYVKDVHGEHPFNPETLAEFQKEYAHADAEAWNDFRVKRLTELVARFRKITREHDLKLSSAVVKDPKRAREVFHQDVARWLEDELVDFVVPMNYAPNAAAFKKGFSADLPAEKVVMGIGVLTHETVEQTREQMDACRGVGGWCLFAYSCFFDSYKYFDKMPTPELRAARRAIFSSAPK